MAYYTDKKTDPKLSEILAVAFPSCTLRQYRVEVSETVPITGTYWSDGYRNSFVAVNLLDLTKISLPHFNPPQFGGPSEDPTFSLVGQSVPVCLVEHSQCGTNQYITFHLAPDNVSKLITSDTPNLTRNEKVVLYATRCYKSSYAGISNYRFHEASQNVSITLSDWDAAVNSLIAKNLLRKNKSITPAGKNAIRGISSFRDLV